MYGPTFISKDGIGYVQKAENVGGRGEKMDEACSISFIGMMALRCAVSGSESFMSMGGGGGLGLWWVWGGGGGGGGVTGKSTLIKLD